jgi:hypothetical protein
VSLKSEEIVTSVRQRGLRVALISVLAAIGIGIADHFTGKIVPALAEKIEHYFDPPLFFVTFSPPVDFSGGITVSRLETQVPAPGKALESVPGTNVFRAFAGPGTYELRLRGGTDRAGLELVDTNKIDRSGEIWKVDTGERNWANATLLRTGEPTQRPLAGSPDAASILSGTRWNATEQDFALIATAEPGLLRLMLANALAEVGVFEDGSEQERRRIGAYWEATPLPGWSIDKRSIMPWGTAFVAWTVRQAGLQIPAQNPAAGDGWRNWGEEVSTDAMTPGMVAIYRPKNRPSVSHSGIVVRRRPNCIEMVAGNIADRVVITCVAVQAISTIRRPPP